MNRPSEKSRAGEIYTFTGRSTGTLPPQLTILNGMAGPDFEAALDRLFAWGIECVDLKDSIYGQSILDLSLKEAEKVTAQLGKRWMHVQCLSTLLFGSDVAIGEQAFRDSVLKDIDRLISLAKILGPMFIRLLTPQCVAAGFGERVSWVDEHAPWLWDLYREVIDRIWDEGFWATVENEIESPLIDSPESALAVFERIDRDFKVRFTWDVQNMWQAGTFPSVEVYERLKLLIGYYHVKGGRSETPGGPLVWRSSLADASWPVREITKRVIADGVSPVICLNPSHGESEGGIYVDYTEADIAWMRESFSPSPGRK